MHRKEVYQLAREIVDDEAPEWGAIRDLLDFILTGKNDWILTKVDPPSEFRPRVAALADLLFLTNGAEDENRTEVGSRKEEWLSGLLICAMRMGAEMAFASLLGHDGSRDSDEKISDMVDDLRSKGLLATLDQSEGAEPLDR